MSQNIPEIALRVVNQIPAMVAYWDTDERCVFSNDAYLVWFGRSPQMLKGIRMEELLGNLYQLNLKYIRGALAGQKQIFERKITLPRGDVRDTIATYTPDIVGGGVLGFSVHVADVTILRQREAELAQALRDAIQVLEETKRSFRSKELGVLRQRLAALEKSRSQPLSNLAVGQEPKSF